MRVALLQIRLDPRSCAANVQRIGAVIDEAAGADPPPDLLVLPGACDTGGARPDRTRRTAGWEGVRATMAWKAREWGVFLAAGSHVGHDENVLPCALLFDADGDIVVQSVSSAGAGDGDPVPPLEPWPSAVGNIAVLEATSAALPVDIPADGRSGVLVAIPVTASLTERLRRAADAKTALLRRGQNAGGGAYWAVVTNASDEKPPRNGGEPSTFLRAPDGGILASAGTGREALVHVEVPLVPTKGGRRDADCG